MHLLHFIVRVYQLRKVPESDLEWEDLYNEGESWFDWVNTRPIRNVPRLG